MVLALKLLGLGALAGLAVGLLTRMGARLRRGGSRPQPLVVSAAAGMAGALLGGYGLGSMMPHYAGSDLRACLLGAAGAVMLTATLKDIGVLR